MDESALLNYRGGGFARICARCDWESEDRTSLALILLYQAGQGS